MSKDSIAHRLQTVRERISKAEKEAGRDPGAVRLIGVSKTQQANAIRDAYEAGLRDFGENYLQEALTKREELRELDICWHFVGKIQGNKTAAIAANFDWVHGVDRIRIARRLSDQRPAALGKLNCCIEVNLSGEESKGGVNPEALPELAAEMTTLDGLMLRGLMVLPAAADSFEEQRKPFAKLANALRSLQGINGSLDTLSMGMSADLEAAITEGATMVRIGTAIFGARHYE